MAFGNIAVALALGTIVFYGLVELPLADRTPWGDLRLASLDGLGLMFGVSLLMFACNLEAVSIEQDMERRELFDGMLVWIFLLLAVLFLGFGVAVYAAFGEGTGRIPSPDGGGWVEATVMQNLPDGNFLIVVKLLMTLNLLLMTPISMLPASRAIEMALGVSSSPYMRSTLRIAVLAGISATAACVSDFETVIGLTGSMGGITSFTVPALSYSHFCGQHSLLTKWAAHGVALFGVLGTAWSIVQIVAASRDAVE